MSKRNPYLLKIQGVVEVDNENTFEEAFDRLIVALEREGLRFGGSIWPEKERKEVEDDMDVEMVPFNKLEPGTLFRRKPDGPLCRKIVALRLSGLYGESGPLLDAICCENGHLISFAENFSPETVVCLEQKEAEDA